MQTIFLIISKFRIITLLGIESEFNALVILFALTTLSTDRLVSSLFYDKLNLLWRWINPEKEEFDLRTNPNLSYNRRITPKRLMEFAVPISAS